MIVFAEGFEMASVMRLAINAKEIPATSEPQRLGSAQAELIVQLEETGGGSAKA